MITELHVHPHYQNHGVGRSLITGITDSATEPRSILSAIDTDSPARGLYRSLGYEDLARNRFSSQRTQAVRRHGRPAAPPQALSAWDCPPDRRTAPTDFHRDGPPG